MLKNILKLGVAAFTSSVILMSQLEAQYGRDFCDECDCNRFWVDAEYLYWQIQDAPHVVPLVASGPTYTPVLGQDGTTVVLGGKKVKEDWRSGGKFSLGYWLDDERCLGVEANYFFLPNESKHHSVFSSGQPGSGFLSTPFYNVITNAEDAFPISNSDPLLGDGAFSGLASYKLRNEMQGAELNALLVWHEACEWKVGLLAGFRYLNFDEKFSFVTNSPYLAFPEDVFITTDKFDVQNNFYGGQIGIGLDYATDCFSFDLKGKVALGATYGKVDIHGHLLTNDFNVVPSTGEPLVYAGGIFALPTNIGNHKKTFFTVIPEVNVNFGYQVMDCLRLKLGYSFLYVSKVLRATTQVNRYINPTQSAAIEFVPNPALVGEASPKAHKKTDSLWAQGLNVGLEFSF